MSRRPAPILGRGPRQNDHGTVAWELESQNRWLPVLEVWSRGPIDAVASRLWDICPSRGPNVPAGQRVITHMGAGFPIY